MNATRNSPTVPVVGPRLASPRLRALGVSEGPEASTPDSAGAAPEEHD